MKARLNIKQGAIVRLAWIDSSGYKGWISAANLDTDPALIESVGVVIGVTESAITISTSLSKNKSTESPLSIPWVAIMKLKVIGSL